MEHHEFIQRLGRSGVLVPPDEWPLLRLLFAGDAAAAQEMLCNAAAPARLFATLEDHGMCGWLLGRLPEITDAEPEWKQRLRAAANREFAACALRRLALHQLDAACAECAAPPIIFKGAANAVLNYPRESTRPSHDIDLMLEPADAVRCFPKEAAAPYRDNPAWGPAHHAEPFQLAGYEVELHHCLATAKGWGQYEHLRAHALPLPGFNHLHGPGPIEAFTIALLHFNFHVGHFTYDFYDLDHIARHDGFCWDRAEVLWQSQGLVARTLPALAVFAALSPQPLDERCNRLYRGLPLRQRMEVSIGLRLLTSRRFTRLRKDWFCTRNTGWPLLWPLAARLLGSIEITQATTRRSKRDPLFWFMHLLGLPARRALSFWR